MSSSIYGKLAVTNLKKNRKSYVPYIFTCVVTIAMFYIMHSLLYNEGIRQMPGSDSLMIILSYGTCVVGIFAVIFLFYTNSFLMKQRKKEIGLYNVLGLGKSHIAKMLICETLIVVAISLILGLGGGILLNKLIFLFLLKMLHFDVALKFSIEIKAISGTLFLFSGIFAANLLFNLIQIKLANPIELLHGGKQGEKEPKTKVIMTIIGVAALGGGYYIAQTTESPLTAMGLFFVAVILVIIGTYALFTAGSSALLKLLKKNKKFYYNTKHFTSVSGMLYRMKQNAVGLANICILSTMVLVMVSTTVALYVGMEDILKTRFPHDVTISGTELSEEEKASIDQTITDIVEKYGLTYRNDEQYEATPFAVNRVQNKFILSKDDMTSVKEGSYGSMYLMTQDTYNKLEHKNVELSENEVLLYSTKSKSKPSEIEIDGTTYQVRKNLKDMKVDKETYMMIDIYYLIVPNQSIIDHLSETYADNMGNRYYRNIDFRESVKDQLPALEEIRNSLGKIDALSPVECRELERDMMYSFYGSFLFLGIFLGALFLMAMVLIIYYKQISEGYDDKERFAIMQKVGMSRREVKQSIRSQVMIVFFLPLVVAVVHIAVAFKVITKLLSLMNLTNVSLFMTSTIITVIVFAVFYAIVFAITAKEYYRIVK